MKNEKYALFIGRWQPFHNGHKHIIDEALNRGKKVCIAIRETEVSDKDPYNVEERTEMIRRVYGSKVKIISIPDIESINVGRNVGYEVNFIEVLEHVKGISGTNVRNGTEKAVPPEVADYIFSLKKDVQELK
ncbi:MAG: adenylyltransferase/cytidyltransferase family protein [Nanoarchaeota archaeon]